MLSTVPVQRRAYEKKVRDPDDCNFDVIRREEERRKLGLPPMIGVVRGMRRATSQELLSDIFASRRERDGELDGTEEGSDPNVV